MNTLAENPIIHVVIPTGGRVDTIGATLLSCHQQTYERMVVWICDNSFEEETACIVNSFCDERFRLIRPKSRLCMAENWEFSIAHLTDGFVTIIGDDDALMPDCLANVSEVIKAYPDIPIINHLPGNYFWPNYPDPNLANKLQIRPMDFAVEVVEAKPILARVCAFTEWYGRLPFLYHGFASVKHINHIKAKTDSPFFSFCAPDIYSDFVLALHTDRFVVVNSALTLGGQSANSNGANYTSKNSIAAQFISELPEHLRFVYESLSMSLMIYNAIEVAFRTYPEQSHGIDVDFGKLLENAVSEVRPHGEIAMAELRSKLLLIYPEALVDKAIEITYSTDEVATDTAEQSASRLRRIARKLVHLPTRVRSLAAQLLMHKPEASHLVAVVGSLAKDEGRSLQGDAVTLSGYLDLSLFNITSVSQAAWFLDQRISELRNRRTSR